MMTGEGDGAKTGEIAAPYESEAGAGALGAGGSAAMITGAGEGIKTGAMAPP